MRQGYHFKTIQTYDTPIYRCVSFCLCVMSIMDKLTNEVMCCSIGEYASGHTVCCPKLSTSCLYLDKVILSNNNKCILNIKTSIPYIIRRIDLI